MPFGVSKSGKQFRYESAADRVHRSVSEHSKIDRVECKDPDRRAEIESDPRVWLKTYKPDVFKFDWAAVHEEIIERSLYAINTTGRFVVAAPRGTGKSVLINWLAFYALVTGRVQFPVVIPWSGGNKTSALKAWVYGLCDNPHLNSEDYGYPEICKPFRESKGISIRLNNLTWRDTEENTGARMAMTEGMIVLPDSRGLIGSSSLKGNPLGMRYPMPDGRELRPDLILIDDPSDRDTARSPARTRENCAKIDADIMGLGGPGASVAALMACSVKMQGDTASHYLSDETAPDWDGVRYKHIISWPEDMKLWEEWNKVRLAGYKTKDKDRAAKAFYKKHRAAMAKGMEVYWAARIDGRRKDPDAYYTAMYEYYRLGQSAFASEHQNDPQSAQSTVFDLSESDIIKAVNDCKQGELPTECRQIVAFTDVNLYGLHWAAIGFANDFTGAVGQYGRDTGPTGEGLCQINESEQERKRLVYEALVRAGERMASLPLSVDGEPKKLSLWLIDGGYLFDVVDRYVRQARLPFRVMASRGYAHGKYRPGQRLVGAPYEQAHTTETAGTKRQYVAFDADHWCEVAQRAWLGSTGAPGSLSIYGRGGVDHRELAEHICRKRLIEKVQTKTGPIWKWHDRPGRQDWGDAVYGCFVAGAVLGLKTSGEAAQQQRRRRPQRRARTR